MICWDLDLVTNLWETTADLSDFYGLPRGIDYNKQPAVALAAVHPDDIPTVLAGRQRAIDSDEPMRYEFRGRVPAADGLPRWFSTRGQVLRDATGRAVRLVAVTTDITERKRAETEREALNRQLHDARRWESLGVLSGGIAHDFNNILTVILGSAGLARKLVPPLSPASPHLDQIEKASRRAAELCRQLLAYSGRVQVSTEKTDLNQLVREAAAFLVASVMKGARIQFELADDLLPLAADSSLVRQVLVNLVANAAEAVSGTEGMVTVASDAVEIHSLDTTGYHLPPQAGHYGRLRVSDTGPGVPADVQARMFDPFYTTKFTGRGLGLASVLGIMRAHHGAIRVTSQPGKGTSVETLWPSAPLTAPAPAERSSSRAGHRALVVDDELFVREVTASTVQELGLEPVLAGDGVTALTLFRHEAESIRVTVVDVVMPGMSGDQLLRELRKISPDLPAVLVSGFTERQAISGLLGPLTDFVQKPFHPEELIAALRRVMGDS